MLQKLTGKRPEIRFSDWRPADQKVYISDIRKVQTKLNWKPTVSPREGVERLVKWVSENLTIFS